jgi:hypothetical protein
VYRRVVVEELGRVGTVGTDASHPCRQVNDDVRPGVVQHPLDGLKLPQVILPAAGHKDFPASPLSQLLHHKGTQEASAARHHDAPLAPELVTIWPVFGHSSFLTGQSSNQP